MDFCQGFAEFLPWEDAQFDAVLFATSLDHVLSLEKTLDEVCRVLRPGGKCIVWAGLIPGSARYEPDREPVVAVDDHHLFHFSAETLLETFSSRFELFESYTHKRINGFYVFSRRADL
jgi:ubiquinone/menaquinone biosynthesis C-methylase UbiE